MDTAEGVTVRETRVGGAIVSTAEAEIEPALAVIVVAPVALVLARPEALMLATLLEELHVTEPVQKVNGNRG